MKNKQDEKWEWDGEMFYNEACQMVDASFLSVGCSLIQTSETLGLSTMKNPVDTADAFPNLLRKRQKEIFKDWTKARKILRGGWLRPGLWREQRNELRRLKKKYVIELKRRKSQKKPSSDVSKEQSTALVVKESAK